MAQAQLFPMALNPKDIVYTPSFIADDMVTYFKPSGKILEPSKGDGVFLKYLPKSTEWCEIEQGVDFFANHNQYDWIVGNPPYSIFHEWLIHSFEIANDIVYLIPIHKCFTGNRTIKAIWEWGGIVEILYYGQGSWVGFNFGLAAGAVHFRKNYQGAMSFTVRTHLTQRAADGGKRGEK